MTNLFDGPSDDVHPPDSRRWLLVLGVLGLMFSLPFLTPFKAPPVPSFHAEVITAALGLLGISLAIVFRFSSAVPLPRMTLVPGILCVLLLAQVLARHVPAVQPALLACLYLLWAGALIIVGATLRKALGLTRAANGLAWFVVIGGVLSALAGAAQVFRSEGLPAWVAASAGAVWGNLGQPNHFANYLALALCSALLLWVNGKLRTVSLVLIAGLLCWVLPLSGSRSIWLYATGFVIGAGVWFYRDRSASNRRVFLATLWLIPAMLAAALTWEWLGIEGLARPTSLDRMQGVPMEERLYIWATALRMMQAAPWAGAGWGQFGWQYFQINGQQAEPLSGYTHHAHNIILHLGAELGLLGVLVVVLGLVLWVMAVRKLGTTPATWWVVSVTGVLGIHAMLEYPLWYTYFLGIAGVVLGLTHGATLEFTPSRLLRVTFVAGLALGWFTLAQLFRDYVYLENFLAFRYRYIDATAVVNQRAKEMLLDIRRESLLAPYVELGLARSIQISPDQLEAKRRVNGHAMRNFPIDDVVYRQAMLLALSGQTQEAIAQWDLSQASYPALAQDALRVLRRRTEDLGGGLQGLLAHVESKPRR